MAAGSRCCATGGRSSDALRHRLRTWLRESSFRGKKSHAIDIREEVDHLNRVYDYDQIKFIEHDNIASYTSAQGFYGASYDLGAKHLHPLKYAMGLRAAALSEGVQLYENTRFKLRLDRRESHHHDTKSQGHCRWW